MKHTDVIRYVKFFNIIDLIGVSIILLTGFVFQILMHEMPCPLCLLQRAGLLAICFGFLLNVRYEIRPLHYAISLLASVFTILVAMRQIALHIIPGEGSYGSAVFGLHLYTWCFIISLGTIIYTSILLSIPHQYVPDLQEDKSLLLKRLSKLAFALVLFVALANVVSGFLECGFQQCPDNPVTYRY